MRYLEIFHEAAPSSTDSKKLSRMVASLIPDYMSNSWCVGSKKKAEYWDWFRDTYNNEHFSSFEDATKFVNSVRATVNLAPVDFPKPKWAIDKEALTRQILPPGTTVVSDQPPKGYAAVLETDDDIARYIEKVSRGASSAENVISFLDGTNRPAILQRIDITELQEGPAESNLQSFAKEKRFAARSLDTMPPLVVMGNTIIDGNHRYRVAKRMGATAIWCYVIEWSED